MQDFNAIHVPRANLIRTSAGISILVKERYQKKLTYFRKISFCARGDRCSNLAIA